MNTTQPILASLQICARSVAFLTMILCAFQGLPAFAAHESPGCPPSACELPNDPTGGGSTNRLTLFPGTTSAIGDNFPGDDNPECGIIQVTDVPFPEHWVSTGSATFTGDIRLTQPDLPNGLPGKLKVTNAIIRNSDAAGGAGGTFHSPLVPLACGAFFIPSSLTASLQVGIHTTIEGAGGVDLVGFEELSFTAVAVNFAETWPNPSPAPSELYVQVNGPNGPTPAPYPVSNVNTSQGIYDSGENTIGFKASVILPSGESFHLPNSIVATFGQMSPPAVPNGSAGSAPMTVAKLEPLGTRLSLSWDTETCEGDSAGYTLIYGRGFPAVDGEPYSSTGAVCGVEPQPFTWDDTPPVDIDTPLLWWLVLANDGYATEGSWSPDSNDAERNGPGPGGASLECGMKAKNLTNTCGQ